MSLNERALTWAALAGLCAQCGSEPRIDENNSMCRECRRKYQREHYRQNKIQIQARKQATKAVLEQLAKSYIEASKNRPCRDCGVQYPSPAMQFDHVSGEKVANVSEMPHKFGIEKIKAEIMKCEVVCANCHAIRTHRRRNE